LHHNALFNLEKWTLKQVQGDGERSALFVVSRQTTSIR
jgi:hypothetical protein